MEKTKQIRRAEGILVNFTAAMFAAVVFCLTLPAQVVTANYGIDGLVAVWADEAGSEIYRYTGMMAVTSYQDSASASAEPGQASSSRYFADLTSGRLGASLSAHNAYGFWGPYGPGWWNAGAESSIGMHDTLDFNVPAGYYADDVTVTIHGFVCGSQSASGNYFSLIEWDGSILGGYGSSSSSFASGLLYLMHDSKVYYYPFVLTNILVPGGTTLSSPSVVECPIEFYFGRSAFQAGLGDGGAPPEYSSAGADFYNTMQITSINVPVGITWTSESGVFLSAPATNKADINNDGKVNFLDFAILASAWGSEPGQANWNPACDISDPQNNIIDWSDLAILAEYWLVGAD